MSTATASAIEPREHIVLRGISWKTYEAMVEDLSDQHVRLIYDQGVLELMSPSTPHERYSMLFGRLVMDVLVGLRMEFEAAGESRWKHEAAERGLEPDQCFFLTPEKLAIVLGRPTGRPDDPLPDLAIEIDWSEPAIDRDRIYASLGIPELWKFDGDRLRIGHLRDDGTYEDRPESRFLPLEADEVTEWIHKAAGIGFLDWIDQLRDWIRDELVPRRDPDRRGGG